MIIDCLELWALKAGPDLVEGACYLNCKIYEIWIPGSTGSTSCSIDTEQDEGNVMA